MIEMLETLALAATNTTSTLPTATSALGLAPGGLVPFGGSMLVGYIIGFAFKKIVNWLLIGLGILAGFVFLAVQWMSQNGYIHGPVNWDKLGTDISSYGQHLIGTTNIHDAFHFLGIPMTSGLGIGLIAGFVHTR